MTRKLPLLTALALVFIAACGAPEEPTDEIQSAITPATSGFWVKTTLGFAPCAAKLSATCSVGDKADARSGPGGTGLCFNYECKAMGTWVKTTLGFAPCAAKLPAPCAVGDKIDARSGIGGTGLCFNYECK